jgi:putative acetyltransferase
MSLVVALADLGDVDVLAMIAALTAELAASEYAEEEMFGYSPEQLAASAVHVLAARLEGVLVGIGGIELQREGLAELKRFYVAPPARGRGVADAILDALLAHAAEHAVHTVRLETGTRQHAAQAFYRRHGFLDIPRFGPYVVSASSVCMEREVGGSGSTAAGGTRSTAAALRRAASRRGDA